MLLSFDLTTRRIGADAIPGSRIAAIKRSRTEALWIKLTDEGALRLLEAGQSLKVTLKEDGKFDSEPVFALVVTSEHYHAGSKLYRAAANYITMGMNALLGAGDGDSSTDKPKADLMGDIQYFESEGADPICSDVFKATIFNNVGHEEDGTPTALPTPEDWIDDRVIRYLPAVVGLTGGGSTNLDGRATVELAAGVAVALFDGDASGSPLRVYELVAGTDAENAPDVIRPDDYDESTNAKVWMLRSPATGGGASNWGELGGTLSDQTDLQAALDAKQASLGFTPPPNTRTISATGLATGGGDLSANRTIDVPIASQAEAEAGVSATKAMTPQRVAQAVAAMARSPLRLQVANSAARLALAAGTMRVSDIVAEMGGPETSRISTISNQNNRLAGKFLSLYDSDNLRHDFWFSVDNASQVEKLDTLEAASLVGTHFVLHDPAGSVGVWFSDGAAGTVEQSRISFSGLDGSSFATFGNGKAFVLSGQSGKTAFWFNTGTESPPDLSGYGVVAYVEIGISTGSSAGDIASGAQVAIDAQPDWSAWLDGENPEAVIIDDSAPGERDDINAVDSGAYAEVLAQGTSPLSAPGGYNRTIEVPIGSGADAGAVAAALASVLDSDAEYSATSSANTVSITHQTPGDVGDIQAGTSGMNVWVDVPGGDTPQPGGLQQPVEIELGNGDSAVTVQSALRAAIEGASAWNCTNTGTDTNDFTTLESGPTTDANANGTGFTVSTPQQGTNQGGTYIVVNPAAAGSEAAFKQL